MIALAFFVLLLLFYFSDKRNHYLVLFFFILTNGFQLIPSNIWFLGIPFLDKPVDILIMSSVVIFIFSTKAIYRRIVGQPIWTYLLLLIVLMFVSSLRAFTFNVGFADQFRVLRYELLPLIALPFVFFSKDNFVFIFNLLYKITLIQSVVFVLQIISGQILMFTPFAGYDVVIGSEENTGILRFYNSPVYLTLFFFYSFYKLKLERSQSNFLCFSILLLALIGPLHRSLVISVFLSLLVFNFLFKFRAKNLGVTISFLCCILFLVSIIPGIKERFLTVFDDLETVTSTPFYLISERDSTFAFRFMHLYERFEYLSKDIFRLLFGIGLMPEDIRQAQELPLLVGNYKEDLGGIKKIDTSDIAWSPLILRYGLAGVFLLIYFIKLFFRQAKAFSDSKIGFATMTYTVSAILGSFAGSEITTYHFKIMLIAAIMIYFYNLDRNEDISNNANI